MIFANFHSWQLVNCDAGCSAHYDANKVWITDTTKATILTGQRDHETGLYMVELGDIKRMRHSPQHFAAPVVRSEPIAQRVAYWAASMGAPVADTLLRAMRNDFIKCPGISATDVASHPPNFTATAKGHMKMRRRGLQPTNYETNNPKDEESTDGTKQETDADLWPEGPPTPGPGQPHAPGGEAYVLTKVIPMTQEHFSEMAGRFPYKSFTGAEYMLIMFCVDANYIHCETMSARTGKAYTRAYQEGIDFFTERGITVRWERLDNETSKELTKAARKLRITIQYLPPHNHRASKAERAIQTWRDHFISILCMTDPDYPMGAWDELVNQAEFTLNLLRGSRTTPTRSAWAHLHGNVKFTQTPIAPAGTKVVVFETPEQRASWATHGVDGFYVGPALQHYRCYKVYVTKTKRTRIAETLLWHPHSVTMPTSSATELLHAAVLDLNKALTVFAQSPPCIAAERQPGQATRELLTIALRQMNELLNEQKVMKPLTNEDQTAAANVTEHGTLRAPNTGQATAVATEIVHTPSMQDRDTNKVENDIVTNAVRNVSPPPTSTTAVPPVPTAASPALPAVPPPPRRTNRLRKKPSKYTRVPCSERNYLCTALAMDESGAKLRYDSALLSSEGAGWEAAANKEFDRLVPETQTGQWIPIRDVPRGRVISYYNPQLSRKRRPHGIELRVRGTYGGDHGDWKGPTAAETADISTFKLLLQSVISDPDGEWLTTDISDFYLGTPMDTPEIMRVPIKYIPAATMQKHNLAGLVHNGSVIMQLNKGIYGLKQAGRLAQQRLIKHLAEHGYYQSKHTPCLFKHETNSVAFTLVVDDFGVKYKGKADAEHLLATLEKLYKIKTNWTGDAYIGFDIALGKCSSTALRTATLSMPRFLPNALKRFNLPPHKPVHNPIDYQPGARTALQKPTQEDTSPAVSPAGATRIKEIVGVFMYYARALDSTFLTAVSKVASAQATPTTAVLTAAERLLQYAASEPAVELVFCASMMDLIVHGDASYLSETKARSRGAGVFFLGDRTQPETLNTLFHCSSTILDVVVAAATEAEYGAAYLNAKQIAPLVNTLEDLGHPQKPNLLFIDNKAAEGIANDTVTQRHSKAMDMRYHLVRDRVRQGQLCVTWAPGNQNLADYLTKAHPTKHFVAMRPFFVTTPPSDSQWTTVGRDTNTGAHSRRLCRRLTLADLPDPRPPSKHQ